VSNFEDYAAALIRSARFVLADGREFVLEAQQHEPGQMRIAHIPGTPQMHRDDIDQLVEVIYCDELGRVAGRLTRVAPSLQS
jgi:hypothetical protein